MESTRIGKTQNFTLSTTLVFVKSMFASLCNATELPQFSGRIYTMYYVDFRFIGYQINIFIIINVLIRNIILLF